MNFIAKVHIFISKKMGKSEKLHIFAPQYGSSSDEISTIMGLTGFDGEMKWYVSTRSWAMGGSLISSIGKLIGNNEYALAA